MKLVYEVSQNHYGYDDEEILWDTLEKAESDFTNRINKFSNELTLATKKEHLEHYGVEKAVEIIEHDETFKDRVKKAYITFLSSYEYPDGEIEVTPDQIALKIVQRELR